MSAHGRGRSNADPIALSYNESRLRMSDVQLLQGPYWLNNHILSFYFEYLKHDRYKNNPDLLFVSPVVTQCMKLMDDSELETLLNQLKAPHKPFIFFALNGNDGDHRSLLVFSRPEKTFFHFDSCGTINSNVSHQFVQHVKDALDCHHSSMKPVRCLQQTNGYDCGIHVICMTDNIADYVNRFEIIDGVGPLHQDTISAKRSELVKLIRSLSRKN